MAIIVSISSFSDVFCFITLPHFSHLCVIINSPPRDSMDIGRIMPRQFDWRSPGLLSTCRDHKHFGQWLVYPLPKTSAPQWAQVKFSFTFVNLFINYRPNASRYIFVNSSASSSSSGSNLRNLII